MCLCQELVQTNLDEAKENLKKMDDEVKSHRHVTSDQFEEYGKTCVSTALSYFQERFDNDDAPLRQVLSLFQSARMCDPTFLTNTSIEDATEHAHFLCSTIPRCNGLEIGIDDELKRKCWC